MNTEGMLRYRAEFGIGTVLRCKRHKSLWRVAGHEGRLGSVVYHLERIRPKGGSKPDLSRPARDADAEYRRADSDRILESELLNAYELVDVVA